MTDIEIPSLPEIEALASPDPATTNWIPLYNLLSAAALQSGPSCRIYRSTVQSISNSGWAIISFDNKRWDTDGIWSAGSPTRLTCRTAGKYLVAFQAGFDLNATGARMYALYLNGTTYHGLTSMAAINGQACYGAAVAVLDLQPGDYVECAVNQNTTGALNILSAAAYSPEVEMVFLGGPQGPPGPAGAGTPGYGTSLPGSPADGQEYVLVDSVTNPSYQWRFRYNAGSSSAYKWEFVGGAPARIFVNVDDSTSTTGSWLNLANGGPTFFTPRAGDYDVDFTVGLYHSASPATMSVGFAVGGSAVLGYNTYVTGGIDTTMSPFTRLAAVGSGVAISMMYYNQTAGTAHWRQRQMKVTPVRVS